MGLTTALASALISALVALLIARLQIRVRMREIENFYMELSARSEAQRQGQLLEVLRSRIQSYPILWRTIVSYTINWPYQRGERDSRWAILFLREIDEWNAESGIFFSDSAYQKFKEFRTCLYKIARNLPEGEAVGFAEYKALYRKFIGARRSESIGLATALKNDMGGYRVAAIQTSKDRHGLAEFPREKLSATEVWRHDKREAGAPPRTKT